MKKSIVIISTYPEHGTKNIGDRLITKKLVELISEFGDFDYKVIWRAASWESVKGTVVSADHVFFACLAIRPNMHSREYPYLEKIVESNIPFSVISAGTDLPVNEFGSIFENFSPKSRLLLELINDKAVVNTTRGCLSQEFCYKYGLQNFSLSGDVAFYNKKFLGKPFVKSQDINKIVISDPHRPKLYMASFRALHSGLREAFPKAKIVVAQHGVNDDIDSLCKSENIETAKIYENPDSGLNIYDDADLHVGFRVHAHVSALSRKVYSYLLEQDGRGCDYGLTISRKISIPNYQVVSSGFGLKALSLLILKVEKFFGGCLPVSPAEQMIALIRADKDNGFEKFVGLDVQIDSFSYALHDAVQSALMGR